MRPQQNRRIRGRSNNNNNGNNRRPSNPLTRNYESNGPDVKIRGNAQHIADKYAALARDVQAAGDRVMAENYLQHAEHYMRIILSAQPQFAPSRQTEPLYEDPAESEASNIVDLPLVDANETPESSLHLIVNRGIEEASHQGGDAQDTAIQDKDTQDTQDDAVPAPGLQQPKAERPRRMTRRRLPRPTAVEKENHAGAGVVNSLIITGQEEGTSIPMQQTLMQQTSIEAEDLSKPQQDEVEKPRRRRRSVKSVDEAAVAE